jgi:tetratricopeptide (TPR) repeat protein
MNGGAWRFRNLQLHRRGINATPRHEMRWNRSLAHFLRMAAVGAVMPAVLVPTALMCGLAMPRVAVAQPASLAKMGFASPSAGDGEWTAVEFSAHEARLLAEVRQGEADGRWLFEAALAADGVQHPALTNHLGRWKAWREQLTADLRETTSPHRRARAIFELLHRQALDGGYQADATGLPAALGGAGYNCVSATILFKSLAQMLGLEAVAVQSPEHVYCVVRSSEGEFAVEMTCPRWFDLSANERREALDELAPSAAGHNAADDLRELSSAGLVALVYYNAGVDHLSLGRFRDALSANRKALAFDPGNELARGNLLATLNNWALARYEARDYATAAGLIEYGRTVAPAHRPYVANLAVVYQRWSEQLLAEGNLVQARAFAARSRQSANEVGP